MNFQHLAYNERLIELRTQALHDFIFSICVNYFKRIEGDPRYPLFKCISFTHLKKSSRSRNTGTSYFRPAICRTKKRSNNISQFLLHFLTISGFILSDRAAKPFNFIVSYFTEKYCNG